MTALHDCRGAMMCLLYESFQMYLASSFICTTYHFFFLFLISPDVVHLWLAAHNKLMELCYSLIQTPSRSARYWRRLLVSFVFSNGPPNFFLLLSLLSFPMLLLILSIPVCRYRITEGVNLPFRVLPTIKELGRTRMEVNVKVCLLLPYAQ